MTTMLVNSRTSTVATVAPRQRLVPGLGRSVPLRCAPCRFKGEDGRDVVQETKEKVQDGASDLKQQFQRGIENVQSKSSTSQEEGLKVNPLTPDFTRRREVFAGRLAMFGYFAACFWEWYYPNHPNVIEQVVGFNNAVGVPLGPSLVVSLLGGLIAYNAISALTLSGAKDNQKDVQKRPITPEVASPADWGFTKTNELLHGRIAMIGFLGIILAQLKAGGYGGPGPLAQIASIIGTPADANYFSLAPPVFLLWVVLATGLAYANGKPGTQDAGGDL